MNALLRVRGVELRYLLTTHLFDHGPATVEELIKSLTYQGFDVGGRASKSVSDALRWEIGARPGNPVAARSIRPRVDAPGHRIPDR